MEKKTPKLFFIWSILMIVIGIIAIRYYYAHPSSIIAALGLYILILGILTLAATSIYTLHVKGEKKLKRLLLVSVIGLFGGLSLLYLNYYTNSHSFDNHCNQILKKIGIGLFAGGFTLFIVVVVSMIAKIVRCHSKPQ